MRNTYEPPIAFSLARTLVHAARHPARVCRRHVEARGSSIRLVEDTRYIEPLAIFALGPRDGSRTRSPLEDDDEGWGSTLSATLTVEWREDWMVPHSW
jgi:hypothetical protein